jgi:hypothetical protein
MQIPHYVKKYPWFWKYIPILNQANGNTIYPIILLKEDAITNLQTKNPDPRYIALLKHEEKHLERQKQLGVAKHLLKYLVSPKFRFEEELIAYKITIKELKKNNIALDIDRLSKNLSGPLYLWSAPYKKAKQALEKAWNKY